MTRRAAHFLGHEPERRLACGRLVEKGLRDPRHQAPHLRSHYGDLTDRSHLTRILSEMKPVEVYSHRRGLAARALTGTVQM